RQFDGVEIFVNIRVIEFDVVDDGQLRQVVHELRTFIKIRGVIFVAFDNQVIAVANPKAGAKVLYDSADQKRGVESASIQHPRGETGSRGLAVRAGNHQRATAADEFFLKNFRKRTIGKF